MLDLSGQLWRTVSVRSRRGPLPEVSNSGSSGLKAHGQGQFVSTDLQRQLKLLGFKSRWQAEALKFAPVLVRVWGWKQDGSNLDMTFWVLVNHPWGQRPGRRLAGDPEF